jgi:hypothetical protein
MIQNPFHYIYEVRPFRMNPFKALDVATDAKPAQIEVSSKSRDRAVQAGMMSESAPELKPGDCITAAELLQDPLLRVAFDLMLDCPELDEERDEEEADRN